MAIHSIRIKNLLSFDDVLINDIHDINCIIGKNNVGKSNLLKLLRYFYQKLNNEKVLPPSLNSNYDSHGSITIQYDITRIKSIVTGKNNNSPFLKHIFNILFKDTVKYSFGFFRLDKPNKDEKKSYLTLTLTIFKDDSIKWSIDNEKIREIISILYPFFDIETRHINLYDWDRIWSLICRLSSFNIKKITNNEVIDFIDDKISNGNGSYKEYVKQVEKIIDTKNYSYQEKVLSYIKVGLKGHDFTNVGQDLSFQSDGTNSHKFIELLLTLLITLTRREFITPIIYIDEPEIGLHPKLNEKLVSTIYSVYNSFEKTKDEKEKGKYKTPYPKLFMATHSPSILKTTIKSFKEKQQVLHFSKKKSSGTQITKLNSKYEDHRFLNVFSDNEARLFFSDYILFVEGSTELEVFSNDKLTKIFPHLMKIDIHCINQETLQYLNPNYSRASIPFLILYDADVLFKFDYTSKLLTLDNGAININNIKKSLCCNFFSKKDDNSRILKSVTDYISKPIEFTKNNISYKKLNYPSLVKAMNRVLITENIFINQTTIEGALINPNSFRMFKRWLCSLFTNQLYMTNKRPDIIIDVQRKRLNNGRTTHQKAIDAIFTSQPNDIKLEPKDKKISDKILQEHLINIIRKIKKYSKNDRNIELNIWRLVFDGKTDTLLSRENTAYLKVMNKDLIDLVKEIRISDLNAIAPYMGKTGGWVTSFIDYSIMTLESNTEKNQLRRQVSIVFPELSAIINNASSSIE